MVGVDPGPFVPVDKGRSGRGLATRGKLGNRGRVLRR